MGKVQLLDHQVVGMVEVSTTEIPDGVSMIKAPAIWQTSNKGDGVVVAVIDTGCDINHPDLKDRIIGGHNFTPDYNGDVNNFQDNHYHGTHVCGTVAASANGVGVVGVAPEAKLLVLKALDSQGSGSSDKIAEAVRYAVDWVGPLGERVRVITMSLGGPEDDPVLHAACIYAVEHGVVVNCAAGNEGDGNPDTIETDYPGAYPEVVCVGACDALASVASFSDTNKEVDILAPGVDILSTMPGGKYGKLSGTSMAAPHNAGALALIIAEAERDYERRLLEAEIYGQICKHVELLPNISRNAQGNGLLQLTRGYTLLDRNRTEDQIGDDEVIQGLLVNTGISQSPDYWQTNAVDGGQCKGEYVKLAFKRIYMKLILRA